MEQREVGCDNGVRERRLGLERQHAKAVKEMGLHLRTNSELHPTAQVPLLGLASFRSTLSVAPAIEDDVGSLDGEFDFTSSAHEAGDVSDSLPSFGDDSAELSDVLDEHDLNPVCWRGIAKPLVITNGTATRAKVPHPRITVGDLAIVRLADMNPDWGVAKVLKIRKKSRSLRIQWFGNAKHSAGATFKPMWIDKDEDTYAGSKRHASHPAWVADVRMSMIVDWGFDLTPGWKVPKTVKDFIITNPNIKWRPRQRRRRVRS